jgi:gliding motility-associated-like protein
LSYSDNCVIESTIDLGSISDYNCITPEPSFSPNFDGVNDEFSPLTNYDQEIEMFVFNRWGNTLYSEKSINPKWDGADLNGAIAPSADYYYILKFNNPEFKDITGVITLIK